MAYIKKEDPMKSAKALESWYPKGTGLEVGMYDQAAQEGKSFSMFLEEMKSEKEGRTIYDGKTMAQVHDIKATLARNGQPIPLTAFEECLKACNVRLDGRDGDNGKVSKFFEFSGVTILFPEYISNQVFMGKKKASLVSVFANETVIDAMNYHKIYIDTVEADEQMSKVEPREMFKETKILVSKDSVTLQKFGTYLTTSYEDVKYQRLPIFAKALLRVGLQIGVDETDDMFYTLINGDGNSNTPGATASVDVSGVIDGEEITKLRTIASLPYSIGVLVGRKASVRKWIDALADYTNPYDMRGFTQELAPQLSMPVMYEWDTSTITTNHIYGVDKEFGIEHLTTGAVMTETEKLIRNQINGTAISYAAGHAIIDKNAVCDFDHS